MPGLSLQSLKIATGDSKDLVRKINSVIDRVEGYLNAVGEGWNIQGDHDASTGAYPAGPSTNDAWHISVAGTISGTPYEVGDIIGYSGTSWVLLFRLDPVGSDPEFDSLTITDTTASTSGSTGSIKTAGGIGAQKDIVTDETFKPLGDTAAGDKAALGYTATEGAIITGQGSTYDVTIKNDADEVVGGVPTGTKNIEYKGSVGDVDGDLREISQSGSAKTSAYTLAVTDTGNFIEVGSGGSIEIPNSTFSAGQAVSIFNNTSGDITITCTITTAYVGGTDSDKATVTLATRGVCTILFISGTVCVITGNVS